MREVWYIEDQLQNSMGILLHTDRLFIKPLTTHESQFILELVNTKGWLEFIGNRNIHTEREATAYIQKIIDNPYIHYWVVSKKEKDSPIGVISFLKRDYLTHWDIGFAFLPASTNNGYAYEATRAVLDNLAPSYERSCILAVTNSNNFSSIKLLKKLGLQFDREIEIEKETLQVYAMPVQKTSGSKV